jgi:hypothetical protein
MAALACLVLAGCAGAGGNPQLASGEKSPPKADSAAAETAAAGSSAASAAALAADPAAIRHRRQAIAEMVQNDPDFRTLFWVPLINAKLAGPFEWNKRPIYCASAQLWNAIGPVETMVIRVERSSNGIERLTGRTGGLFECMNANYVPFPELEEARAKERKARGLD